MSVLSLIFDSTLRELRRARVLADRISAFGPEMEGLTEEQLRGKTDEFRGRLANGETLDDLMLEAFALVREATWRALGNRQIQFRAYREGRLTPEEVILPLAEAEEFEERLKSEGVRYERERFMAHFDVQMIGAIMLHWGRVAEMRTGEGKTQVAVAALYLNALEGKGAHLLTHNDYLAKRDRDWMAPIYEMLGLRVGVIQHDMTPQERQEAYSCDVTYATNSEVGFDYLRDNTVDYADWLVLQDLHYGIVDEADSLLVDEARTPLILAGMGTKPTELYRRVERVIPRLQQDTDYIIDEKGKSATLTDDGLQKAEGLLGVSNLSDPENLSLFQHVSAALRAHACYKRDVDYVVRDRKVIIVDEFTGRLMQGRRFSAGLHQAIEAKEKVQIERENVTMATITHQNFFRLYKKLAGMTGTAKTEEPEFVKVFGMPVAVIPTHRPMIREDNPDVIYKTGEGKLHGITAEILQMRSLGRPTLVGTRSIEMSERLSERMKAERLQLFAQLALLEDTLLGTKELEEAQSRELERALRARLGEIEREVRHLDAAVSKFEQGGMRVAQPEEQRRMEQRLTRLVGFAEELQGLVKKLEGKGKTGEGEIRRMAEIICYQALEEVPMGRTSALLRTFGIDPDVTTPQNARHLADLVGLEEEQHTELAEVLSHGVPHRVLNAKYHEMEAHIIAQAGRPGALTIATNMAGRGVDILLGGNPQEMANELLREEGVDPNQATEEQTRAAQEKAEKLCARNKELVLERGGLHILGTERHESRRIDNQLRGRSGRQGDPGSSRFYVSFEDELMRLFGPERLSFFLSKWPENEAIEAKITSRMIENAQKKVEAYNFDIRRHQLQYDDVMNHQRTVIYEQRKRVLLGEDLRESIVAHLTAFVDARVREFASPELPAEDWNLEALQQTMREAFPLEAGVEELAKLKHHEDLVTFLQEEIAGAYQRRVEEIGSEQMAELERLVTLRVVSKRWIDHLAGMEDLKEGIGLRGYAGVDPLIVYQKESYTYWQNLLATIRDDIVRYMFRVEARTPERQEEQGLVATPQGRPVEAEEQGATAQAAGARSATALKAPPSRGVPRRRAGERTGRKVGRNDPCPCGSGKKFKKCCGRSQGPSR